MKLQLLTSNSRIPLQEFMKFQLLALYFKNKLIGQNLFLEDLNLLNIPCRNKKQIHIYNEFTFICLLSYPRTCDIPLLTNYVHGAQAMEIQGNQKPLFLF